jgi:uncharacterized protein (TIGR02611 family)
MTPVVNKVARWVWYPFGVILRFIARNGKRIAVSVAGLVLLLLGVVMMVLPGPGIVFILLGLAVLATEYVWAQRALNYTKQKAEQAKDKVLGKKAEPPPDPGADDVPSPD